MKESPRRRVTVTPQLKGTVPLDFLPQFFFHESVSPQAPEYTIRVVSNFFENSLIYSQLKWKKSSIRKVLIMWVVELTYRWIFFLQVHFKVSTVLIKVPLFATGVVDTSGTMQSVSLTPVVHLHLRISLGIFKKFEMTLMLFSGAWGKMIHEKNLKQKARDTVPLIHPLISWEIVWYWREEVLLLPCAPPPKKKLLYSRLLWSDIPWRRSRLFFSLYISFVVLVLRIFIAGWLNRPSKAKPGFKPTVLITGKTRLKFFWYRHLPYRAMLAPVYINT